MGALQKPSGFKRIMSVAELPPGGGVPVKVDGRSIALFNVDGQFHAIDNECPHRGGSLADGALSGSLVTCPLHRWQFDVGTGQNPMNPDLCVQRYAVRVSDGGVWVNLDAETASV
jgi:nitrite reductase (NADH) small subunit